MAAGTLKLFYGFEVLEINEGAGGDTSLVRGGFMKANMPALDGNGHPTGVWAMTGLNDAINKGLAFLRRYQSNGEDCRCNIYYHVYGNEADTPVRAYNGPTVDTLVCRIDAPEKSVLRAISLANRELVDETANEDNQLPQDVGV